MCGQPEPETIAKTNSALPKWSVMLSAVSEDGSDAKRSL